MNNSILIQKILIILKAYLMNILIIKIKRSRENKLNNEIEYKNLKVILKF